MISTKKLFIPLVLCLFASSLALAITWHEKFVSNYSELGIDLAVEKAVQEDQKTPDQIIKIALPIEGLKKEVLIKALFCSGAKPEKVNSDALKNDISEEIINDGYQLALTECSRRMEEYFNYIPVGSTGGANFIDPPKKKKKPPKASPWNFK